MNQIQEKDLQILTHKQQVQFAIFCAKQVEYLWNKKPACVKAIQTAEAWLAGKATAEECRSAARAAANATYAAAYATYAAAYAADAANKQAIIAAQWNYYYELLGKLWKILYL